MMGYMTNAWHMYAVLWGVNRHSPVSLIKTPLTSTHYPEISDRAMQLLMFNCFVLQK